MLPYDDALHAVLTAVQPLKPCSIQTVDAGGLVLAEGAEAQWDMPGCDNSAMDGYALSAKSLASNSTLEIIGASYAGHPFPGSVPAGQAIRITTGAALPRGTDTVVPLEEAKEVAEQLSIQVPVFGGEHVRHQGEEFKSGEQLLQPGTLLQAGEISLLACAGVSEVKVYPRPRVAIISTGDELIELGEKPGPGQIVNSNQHFLTTRLQECGYEVDCISIGRDNVDSLGQCFSQALAADLIISTGGVSVGEKDQIQSTLNHHSFDNIFWKVSIKPGKPILFGLLEGRPYFGLPGNPAATAATFEIFVRPALKRMTGHADCQLQKRSGVLTHEVNNGGKRQLFLWCQLKWRGNQYEVTAQTHQNSGQSSSIQGANALLTIPVGSRRMDRGERVEVLLLE